MLNGCGASCERRAEQRRNKDPRCDEYAARGDCDKRFAWMQQNCWTACDQLLGDTVGAAECDAVVASGGCGTAGGLTKCRATCMARHQANRSADVEGNCWYWATDGECGAGGLVDVNCRQSCTKLRECAETPESEGCAKPFECPVARDERPGCVAAALRGECRVPSAAHGWTASGLITRCSTSCHLLDPPAVSHT
eukprot:1279145-Prymnesium_polylepis.1